VVSDAPPSPAVISCFRCGSRDVHEDGNTMKCADCSLSMVKETGRPVVEPGFGAAFPVVGAGFGAGESIVIQERDPWTGVG